MNKIKALEKLRASLKDVQYHYLFIEDIREIILGTGHENSFFRIFEKRLRLLKELRYEAIKTNDFEKLKDAPGLYSMHIASKNFNIRIIYTFCNDDEVLILGFYEREGKTKTDYTNYIPAALERKREFEEEIDNEKQSSKTN